MSTLISQFILLPSPFLLDNYVCFPYLSLFLLYKLGHLYYFLDSMLLLLLLNHFSRVQLCATP